MNWRWSQWPVVLRAIIAGLLIFVLAANVWPPLLLALGVQYSVPAEASFLGLFVWWASGGSPPKKTQSDRRIAFRRGKLSAAQCGWGMAAALSFAITVHSALVVLFRFELFPIVVFRSGYDLSFIPSLTLKWIVVVVSALSAGICEETAFRGYIQRPIETAYGAPIAIFVSSLFFTLVHLSQGWAIPGILPIIFMAGILLGVLAWSSRSLVPGMVGHVIMDIGLFAYWWSGLAGDFTARPVVETGPDEPFLIACGILASAIVAFLFSVARLRRVPSASTR
jgi:membrane protease YdiL (CAAX protease family)